ncbi:MAG TPA: PAS domain S-box protein [Anaerolineae bacterium]
MSRPNRSSSPAAAAPGGPTTTTGATLPRDPASLAHADQGFRHLFDGAADPMFVHDLAGHFLEVNAAACRQLGYTREELLAMTVAELDAPEITAEAEDRWPVFLAAGELVIESVHVRKDGSRVPVELNVRLIEHDGQRWVLTVARDITERKRVEEELRRLNEQVRHLATLAERERLSREFHDGLAQVLGCVSLKGEAAQLALRGGQIGQAEQRVDEIIEMAQRAYGEVREAILDLRTHTTQGVGLKSVLDEYLARFTRDWGIETSLIVTDAELTRLAPPVEVQILRIIQEALTNVRRHAAAKRATVRFEAAPQGQVRVSVGDDGCGFDPAEARARSFGLQSMRERAESAGGSLEITSRPGAGATIAVVVPRGM